MKVGVQASACSEKLNDRRGKLKLELQQQKRRGGRPRPEIQLRRLIFCGGFGHDVHPGAVLVELHPAVGEREERPIAARADIFARDELAAALAHDDAARADDRAAKFFYAKPFADAVAPVADAALTFLMCHKLLVMGARRQVIGEPPGRFVIKL